MKKRKFSSPPPLYVDEAFDSYKAALNIPLRDLILRNEVPHTYQVLPTFWLDRKSYQGWEEISGPQSVFERVYFSEINPKKSLFAFTLAFGATGFGTHYVGFVYNKKQHLLEVYDSGTGTRSETYGGGTFLTEAARKFFDLPKVKTKLGTASKTKCKVWTFPTAYPVQRGLDDTYCQTWSIFLVGLRTGTKVNMTNMARKLDTLKNPKNVVERFSLSLLTHYKILANEMNEDFSSRLGTTPKTAVQFYKLFLS